MFFYDYWYLVFCVPPLIFALIAQFMVRNAYSKYSRVMSASGLDGAHAALAVLRHNGVPALPVQRIAGTLTDNYNPKTNVISLSQGVYDSHSVAAIGIASHEAGHACQYATGYYPIRLRAAVLPAANIGSFAGIWLAILGVIFALQPLAYFGVALYIFVVAFQLVTLPVEINASRRAVAAMEEGGLLVGEELDGAKKVLRAAALTYVAALASSIGMLLRLLAIVGRRD